MRRNFRRWTLTVGRMVILTCGSSWFLTDTKPDPHAAVATALTLTTSLIALILTLTNTLSTTRGGRGVGSVWTDDIGMVGFPMALAATSFTRPTRNVRLRSELDVLFGLMIRALGWLMPGPVTDRAFVTHQASRRRMLRGEWTGG